MRSINRGIWSRADFIEMCDALKDGIYCVGYLQIGGKNAEYVLTDNDLISQMSGIQGTDGPWCAACWIALDEIAVISDLAFELAEQRMDSIRNTILQGTTLFVGKVHTWDSANESIVHAINYVKSHIVGLPNKTPISIMSRVKNDPPLDWRDDGRV